MAVANLLLRFLVELGGIAAAGYAGYQLAGAGSSRWITASGAALVVGVLWALVVAPNTQNGLSQPQKDIIGTVILVGAAGMLAVAGQLPLAIGLAIVVVANAGLLFVFGHEAREQLAGVAR